MVAGPLGPVTKELVVLIIIYLFCFYIIIIFVHNPIIYVEYNITFIGAQSYIITLVRSL